ncbi:hypothetical protein WJX81_006294 [Elliptochloris bilobata]|uniref:dolichyl-phosphate beta-glucosyltransferase n=1 Tax=Elliptochloris bilobata TaxID=381761 RepID=A0AAW1R328_9CHLO
MNVGILTAVGLVTAVLAALVYAREWFARLDTEAVSRTSEQLLENPASVEKVPAPSVFSEVTKSLSIVVPAFNEEARLPATLDETLLYLQRRRDRKGPTFTYEVVIVDDGSTDATVRVAMEYVRRHGFDAVRVMRLPANRGKGAAVKAGMLAARGEALLMMDADGATQVRDLERLEAALARVVKNGLGIAVGSRAHLQAAATAKRSWYRNLLMRGFHLLVVLVAGSGVKDTQCGFKLFTRAAARRLYPSQRLQRWCFDVELLLLAQALGVPVVETSVTWTEIPGSKIKVTSIIHMAWELAALLLAYQVLGIWTVLSDVQVARVAS